jgi:lysophospholipase L1-like esterase
MFISRFERLAYHQMMLRSRLSAAAGKYLYSVGMLAALLLVVAVRPFAQTAPAQSGWEPAIREFEEQDKVNPPRPGCIVFAGSSGFRDWDTLVSDMKPLDVVNRGFGGSGISDLNEYAKRIVIAYKPSAVVVYEGDNDLADGSSKSPQMVAGGFRRFIQIVHTSLPDTWIYILSIKPSKLRWAQWPRMEAANELIKDYAVSQSHVLYIDVATPMFDAKGKLPPSLFKSDGVHPTAKLYAKWTAIIKPILLQRFGPGKTSSRLDFSVFSLPSVANLSDPSDASRLN